ncbi:exodeoxyribonuclease V subunit gamma [Wenzhouxiangella limi]|uniref:RecBCD enzyme subunit RecC n=1 Tax=Wenzhouxiangella limi TaxID=2707351 RepID=A0A845UWK2_9GAMM|nr:exodeoxyribonuclease V subunit gamma [Wenzhouxiangella limi]NDY95817.1 exodeoxyribonuclease V subunit gamma [Wenzhouxiangella limi]
MVTRIESGLAVLQSNRPEDLRQLLVSRLGRAPLAPLEDEIILVQSGGIGRWLQLGMAESVGDDELSGGLGISASVRTLLPARFLWEAYRQVLGEQRLPEHSLFDAERLRWLIYRLLDSLLGRPGFEPITGYLAVEPGDAWRRFQLAGRVADLFEAYQFFRADWLLDWEAGRDRLRLAGRSSQPLPAEQAWQPVLWRALIEQAGAAGGQHRARLHADFVAALEDSGQAFPDLPRRVSVFGISSLPEQSLRALAALARRIEVLVFVHNPSRYFWGNLVEARDDYRRWNPRHPLKTGMPDRALAETEISDWGNPLLASWGKQGRDFIGLLDRMDRPEDYRHWFDDRIDLFSDFARNDHAPLLAQLQQDILELEPPPSPDRRSQIGRNDESIVFTIAHSRQREVEILHDHLLAAFEDDPRLQPRDVIVMVPDIEDYAPHVEAVFGRFAGGEGQSSRDERQIPFSIADRSDRAGSSLLRVVEVLLSLPRWRFTAAEVLDLLRQPAVRARFGMQASDLDLAERWLDQAGVRWGLDGAHRDALLDMTGAFEQNSWRFGLDRMMLGYASGDPLEHAGILAFDEVSAGEAPLVAQLAGVVEQLGHWRTVLDTPATPTEWGARLGALVEAFLAPADDEEALARHRFDAAVTELLDGMRQAGLDQPIALEVVRDALLASLDTHGPSSRFLAGRVNFCTLLPMRAIPFRRVCLLGMNDGEYPRTRKPADFDLMEAHRRPGDRSRREDDRYLFLEALLSAREQLYVSWVGRSIRDNAPIPPSVLVGQLRDAITAGWTLATGVQEETGLVDHLTTAHPLQPFSREYFRPGQTRLITYAREWGEVWDPGREREAGSAGLALAWPEQAVRLRELARFYRRPASVLVQQRLRARLLRSDDIGVIASDEPLELGGLARWQLLDDLLAALAEGPDPGQRLGRFQQQLRQARLAGRLPPGPVGEAMATEALEQADEIARRYVQALDPLGPPTEDLAIDRAVHLKLSGSQGRVRIEDCLSGLRADQDAGLSRVCLLASGIGNASTPAWDKLAGYWPDHLAACAAGQSLRTVLVGKDKTLALEPVEPALAGDWLERLVECWLVAQTGPIPAAPLASCAYLKAYYADLDKAREPGLEKALDKAAQAFAGGPFAPGDLGKDPSLARLYPDFDALLADDGGDAFRAWSERLYGPLVRAFLDQGKRR